MKISKKIITLMSFALTFNVISAFAADMRQKDLAEIKQAHPKDERLNERIHVAKPSLPLKQITPKEKQKTKPHTLSLTKEELARRPDLIVRGLIPAVMQNNVEAVELLFPLYKKQPNQDLDLDAWSQAILARKQGDYSKSVEEYRKVFSRNPNLLPLRYQLAQALFLNNDNEAARIQFIQLRSEAKLADSVNVINQYLTALNQRDEWKISGGASFLNESNINNAPKAGTKIGNWTAWQRESAHGFAYNVDVEKKWSLRNQLFAKFITEINGKYFWDNKKYNELNIRTGVGMGYQTARSEIGVLPFTERRWYAGGSSGSDSMKRYSQNSGVRLNAQHWLNEKWQISTALEYGEQRYVKRKHLNGNNYLWSNTLLYVPKSGQYWFGGLDYSRENTRDRDNAYQRKGVRVGWAQEWGAGISTRVILSYARRTYKDVDLIGIRQKNNEYASTVTVWHRNVHFAGITPKLSWSYQKVSSNHAFYQYDKNRLYLEISKTF